MQVQSPSSSTFAAAEGHHSHSHSALDQLAERWLRIQCSMVKELITAQFVCCNVEDQSVRVLANWPNPIAEKNDICQEALNCLSNGKQFLSEISLDEGGVANRIAFPIIASERFRFAVVLDLKPRSELMLRSVINMLQWGETWFRFAYIQPERKASVSHLALWDNAARCLEQKDFRAVTSCLVSQLASTLRCSRVSFGRLCGKQIEVVALSHTANFSRKTESIRRLANAMSEAVLQDSIICVPKVDGGDSGPSAGAHKRLSDSSLNGSLCTVPISSEGQIFAALTLERELERPFQTAEIEYIEHLLSLLAVNLFLLNQQADSIAIRTLSKIKDVGRKLRGSGNGGLKLKLAATVLAVLFLVVAQGDYKVTSIAVVEGRIQRSVVAPQDGFLASAEVRAGDLVVTGQAMGQLDNKDLTLEQLSISGQQQELLGEYREAIAEHDSSRVGVVAAQIEQANARMELVNEKLKRTRFLAPFDGLIIEGDLSQSLGAPVSKGDVLFKVAPLEDYRIVLHVNERDIAPIEAGLRGTAVLTSLPGQKLPVRVERISSVSTAENANNYFRVEASLLEPNNQLRPGMEGAAKLDLGERSLVWIWTHKLTHWLKLKLWVWLP